MKIWATLTDGFSRWIDAVADFIVDLSWQFASPRPVKLIELGNDEFVLQPIQELPDTDTTSERIRITEGKVVSTLSESIATTLRGSRIELTLKPERFLFRPLELPGRAAEFLDGIVRAHIDRLTPWSASDAAFGWSKPGDAGSDRIVVTVAATVRTLIAPYVQAVAGFGVRSIAVFTTSPNDQADAAPIKIMEERAAGFLDVGKIRSILIRGLVATAATATAVVMASVVLGISLDAQQDELNQRIASLRAAAGPSSIGPLSSLLAARLSLEDRKNAAPSNVMIIETLSRILPDNTYLTELRIEDNKIQLVGITRDAPSLISLMEQSGQFMRATFFAPTTRSPSDPGENFHIQAVIQPLNVPRS
jgi:general secretion pathway protein L